MYRALASRDARFDGRVFYGVRSTGVYCRPICPARTARFDRVVFFPNAAAAQASGFRPCLRCRPEAAPDLALEPGGPRQVRRALALIEDGVMDEAGVEELAERVHLSARQLRRLFLRHLGATPVEVAQAKRLNLAKQLLHETDMPLAEVALAAGYGSVRRFNEVFRDLFPDPPRILRRQAAARSGAPGSTLSLRLSYRPPHDVDALLAYLAGRAMPGVEQVSGEHYSRTLDLRPLLDPDAAKAALPGEAAPPALSGAISLRPERGRQLRLDLLLPHQALSTLPRVVARVRRLFDLSADPEAIAQHLSLDPFLAPLVEANSGLRAPGTWDGFELAVRAILGQQVTVVSATRQAGRLVQAFGSPVQDAGVQAMGLHHLFPLPGQLADADVAGLGMMPGARAAAIVHLARALQQEPTLLASQADLATTALRLRALPGIGEWTAQYVAMRALREPDAFPAADVGLRKAMEGAFGRRPSAAELLARAEAWRPWRAYAANHLWASLQPAPSRDLERSP